MAETYCLPPKLDLAAAATLAADIEARLNADLTLDAGAVTQIGALCVQVIASAALSFQSAGHALTLTNTPDRVLEQLRNLGFTPETLVEAPA